MMSQKWWKSKYRSVYLTIAMKHLVSPKMVQLISHGYYSYDKTGKIVDELLQRGVLRKKD